MYVYVFQKFLPLLPDQNFVCVSICPVHATLTAHLVACDLTTLIISDERYKL